MMKRVPTATFQSICLHAALTTSSSIASMGVEEIGIFDSRFSVCMLVVSDQRPAP